jgi:integrase
MATLSSDNRVQTFANDGKRVTIRLGARVGRRLAERFRQHVNQLEDARKLGESPGADLVIWLDGLCDDHHAKLARAGLTKPREARELLRWVDAYIGKRESDLAVASIGKLRQTRDKLAAYFTLPLPLPKLTRGQCQEWRRWLAGRVGEATVRQHCRNLKAILNDAVNCGYLRESAMRGIVSASIASENPRYVTPAERMRIIDACQSGQWKLFAAMACFLGLRVPSETHGVRWGAMDWARSMLVVPCKKTERHHGKATREVPVPSFIADLMRQVKGDAGPDTAIIMLSKNNLARKFKAILRRVGFEPWPDLFQTLRRSSRILMDQFAPASQVDLMMGHGEATGRKHYSTRIADEVAENMRAALDNAAHGSAQNGQKMIGTEPKPEHASVVVDARNANTFAAFPAVSISGGGIRTHDQGIMSPRL